MSEQVEIKCQGAASLSIDLLIPFQGKLKTLSTVNYKKLKNDILTLGFSEPISVWMQGEKFYILNGHQRLSTLKKMEKDGFFIPPIPVNYVEADSYKQAKKKVLSLTSQFGEMNADGFEEFVSDIDLSFEEVEDFRFPELDMDTIKDILTPEEEKKDQEEKENKIPEVNQLEVTVKKGDIYGFDPYEENGVKKYRHRLMCGDSTNKEDVDKFMDGEKAHMVFTSPPYSDQRDYRGDIDLSPEKLSKAIFNFDSKIYFVNLGLQIKERELVTYWDFYLKAAKKNQKKLLSWNVWDKSNASAPGHQQAIFGLCHEWIFVFGDYIKQNHILKNKGAETWGDSTVREKDGSLNKKSKVENQGFRQLDTVVRIQPVKNYSDEFNEHPAQFPIELADNYIRSSTVEPPLWHAKKQIDDVLEWK